MAEEEHGEIVPCEEEHEETNYKPPPEKSLTEMVQQDQEGISYKMKIDFHVQREIVTGLKYVQRTYRKGIQVEKMSHMVGSYAPKMEVQSYTTPVEDAPSGLIARGHYNVKSIFTDDDSHEHLKWEWSFDIKKDWA